MNSLENKKLEELLETVQRPARYTGGEMNAVVKDWNSVRCTFGFCFADTYEIGMSHLGMKILYYLINQREDALCERLFMPDADMADKMRAAGVPLFSLESRAALNEFDIIGFTLQYEMSYTNILEMLDLGRVPIRREDRGEKDTIVVAGGPCAFNPEPLAPFIDAFMIGDGEDVMHELIDVIRDGREAGLPRIDILRNLAKLEGVYVPAFYDVAYNEDGTLKSFAPNDPAAPARVKKRVVKDLSNAVYPESIPVPYTEIVHDR
ncbi:MAG: B12-binding domain-containing radical SAM protein, partial [Clostridia bacterium]|nr:B12-binding domain-containing radical SAM protein [Clostridia bacterium]